MTAIFRGLSEFENAALTLGFKPATLRQWKHRGKVPGDAKMRLVNLFDQPFQIIDEPKQPQPQGMTLASQFAKYLR